MKNAIPIRPGVYRPGNQDILALIGMEMIPMAFTGLGIIGILQSPSTKSVVWFGSAMIVFGLFMAVFFADLIWRTVERKDGKISSRGPFFFFRTEIEESEVEGLTIRGQKWRNIEFLLNGKLNLVPGNYATSEELKAQQVVMRRQ
jgi:hypothetical protein